MKKRNRPQRRRTRVVIYVEAGDGSGRMIDVLECERVLAVRDAARLFDFIQDRMVELEARETE